MGICSADFTSPNRHNDVWSAYQILVTVLLPYLVSFLSYCAIYRRSPQSLPAMDKAISYDDVWALNILCSTTVICCVLSSTYYAVTLSNANGVAISKDTMFAVLYLYASSWVVLYFMAGISNNTLLDRVRSCLIACGIYAKEAIIYEPDTNYQMRRSSVARSMLGKFTRNDIYKDRSDFKCWREYGFFECLKRIEFTIVHVAKDMSHMHMWGISVDYSFPMFTKFELLLD